MKKITRFEFLQNRTKIINRWLGKLSLCMMILAGSISYSNPIQPEGAPSYLPLVYCTPSYTTGCAFGDDISNVTLQGESVTLNNSTTACSANAYQNYTALPAPDLAPGNTYSISVSTSYDFATSEEVKVWIDFNNDETFSESELIANTNGNGLPSSGTGIFSFTVPTGVVAGDYRMRVRLVYYTDTFGPCDSDTYGETEDYTISIIQLDNCTGTPTAGTVTSPINVCAGKSLTLSTSGATAPADGLMGIWQLSPAGMNTWTDLADATSVSHTMTNGVLENTDFRYKLTCTYSNQTAFSDVGQIIMNPGTDCYCTPTYSWGCDFGARVNDVITSSAILNINNTGTGCGSITAPIGYSDYTASHQMSVGRGMSFDIEVGVSNYSAGVKVWIDFNQDGLFGADELVTSSAATIANGSSHTATILVPPTALVGETRMRVRAVESSTTFDACGTQNYGETEDYSVEIIQLDDCVGTPTAGTVTSPLYACANTSFTLTTLGATAPADGLVGIWQSSPAGMNDWVDVVGAISTTHVMSAGVTSNTDFRYKLTCLNSNETDISGTISVLMNDAVDCYCIPIGTSTTNYITDFSTTGGSENISNTTSGLSANGYGDFTFFHNVTQEVSGTITFEAITTNDQTSGFKIWVDWNQNGNFDDAGELVYATAAYANIHTGSFTVPGDALEGQTRMRIGNSNTPNTGPASPCMTNLSGEFEDYMFTVVVPTCPKPFALTLDAVTTNSATISWTSSGALFDIEWGEEGFFQSGVPTTSGVPNPTTISGLDSSTTYEFYVRQDCGVDGASNWAGPFKFTTECLPPNITGTTPGEVCGEGEVTLSATADGGTIAWYANETGGTKLSEGASFTTPVLTETTSYWVETFEGINGVGGRLEPNYTSGSYTTAINYGLVFTATESFILNTVDVYLVGSAGNLVVNLTTNTGTILDTRTIALPALGTTTTPAQHTINLDFEIEPGEYRLIAQSSPNMVRESSVGGFPYAVGDVASITNGYISGTSTTYYYFYNWVYNNGCGSPRTEVIATVTDAPDFELSQTTLEICEGDTSDAVTITTGASDYDTFEWTPSLGVSGDATTGWSFDPTETTTYVLTASQSAGVCTTSVEFTITVNAAPVLIGITASATEICEGSSVELIANSATAASYCPVAFPSDVEPITLVEFEEISNATSATVNGTPNLENFTNMAASVIAGNTYSITVNGNTNGSYTNNFYVYIDWNQNGVFTDPGETYSIGSINSNNGSGTPLTYTNILVPSTALNGNTRMRVLKKFSATTNPGSCNTTGFGQAEDYTVNVTGGVNLYDYSWSDGTSEVGTTSPLTVNPTTTTTYTVTVTGANGCTIAESIEITVNETPDAPVATSPQLIAEGQTIADIIVTGDNLTWYTDEDLTDEVDASTVLTEGTYTFYVTDSMGDCTSEATMITVEVSLSTKDFDTATFKAYPNPVKDYFNISYSKNIQNIAVINMLGQTIFTKNVNATDTQIDMTSLPTGTYFVKVNVDGAVKTIKVAKQ